MVSPEDIKALMDEAVLASGPYCTVAEWLLASILIEARQARADRDAAFLDGPE